MKESLAKIESLLKNDDYGIMIYWNEDEEDPEIYNTAFMCGDEDYSDVDLMNYELLESLFRFANKNSTLKTSQSMLENMPAGVMFSKDPEITKFHKKLKQYSYGKEILIFCEDGERLGLRIIETLDLRSREHIENLLAEVFANDLKEILVALNQIMTNYLGSLI